MVSDSKEIERKRTAAFHEAGHALVAWALRIPIEQVSTGKRSLKDAGLPEIDSRIYVMGQVIARPKGKIRGANRIINQLAMLCAGGIAEYFHTGEKASPISTAIDMWAVEIILSATVLSQSDRDAVMRHAEAKAHNTLCQHPHEFIALANTLFDRKTMSGAAVRKFLREHSKGRR